MIYLGTNDKKIGGIYKISNMINNKVYIGRTVSFLRRYNQYMYDFKNKRIHHLNNHLLSSMTFYGLENFKFEILCICSLDESLRLEIEYMNLFNSLNRDFGYNIRSDSDGGMIVAKETSLKISTRLKKEWKEGRRNEHSEKLKQSWNNRSRTDQSKVLSKTLTKYYYTIDDSETKLYYNDLVNMGLKSCISSFHRNKSNICLLKGLKITRYQI